MYTLKITASELEELRAVAPKIAAKAKAVTPPPSRSAEVFADREDGHRGRRVMEALGR